MNLILAEERSIRDYEFQTRTGITRDELRSIIAEWPHLQDDNDEDSRSNPDLIRILAINNCLNEALHGIRISDSDWMKTIDESREEVERIYQKWATIKGWKRTGLM